jgi:hypothetical protein
MTGGALDEGSGAGDETMGLKFDTPDGESDGLEDDGGACGSQDPRCNCTAVDVLFVIDNSTSMYPYQVALGMAFPDFADAIVEALPPGTSVHVGVTSTEMGYAYNGNNVGCAGFGNDGMPAATFYDTPDVQPTATNGAQGRLFEHDGQRFVAFDTAVADEVAAVKTWFSGAAAIGEGGSNVEMATAVAGWMASPVNDATNAGFVRDDGALLVLFFVQDEPDQTPPYATQEMLDDIAAKKAVCGGLDCVLGGGFVNLACLPEVPLGTLLDGLGAEPVVESLPPWEDAQEDPAAAAEQMRTLLRDTLTDVIAAKCGEIGPPG